MYRIKLKGTLPDILSTIDWVFDIKISTYQISQPSFLPEPLIVEIIEVIVGLSKEKQYSLPVDNTCKGCYVTHDPPLPQFIKFEYPFYKFKVVQKRDCCKMHIIKGKLLNDLGFVPFSF